MIVWSRACRLHIYLANLFNGDRLLGDTTNRFLNENWSEILNELKPVLRAAIGDIISGVISPVFSKFSYDDLFLWSIKKKDDDNGVLQSINK